MGVAMLQRQQARAAVVFLGPAYLLYAAILLAPALATFFFTLFYIDRTTFGLEFVGTENYEWVLGDKRFWKTFANTFHFISMSVVGNVGLGLLFAVQLNRALPAAMLYVFRLVFFLPVLASIVSVAFVWKFIYSTDLGLLNYYLGKLGIGRIGWLSDQSIAMLSVVIFDIWKNFGFFMVIFLAALQSVPKDLLEAASIDGARPHRVFLKITVPIISPVIFFCVTIATIGGLQVFDSVKVLTNGGPGDATRPSVMYILDEAFGAGDISTGAVAALILLIVIGLVTALQFYFGRKFVQT